MSDIFTCSIICCYLKIYDHIGALCNSPMISNGIPVFYPLGLDWDSISECVEWMVPFVSVAKKVPVKLKNFKKVAEEDRHNIQTHTNYLDMLVGGFTVQAAESALHTPPPQAAEAGQTPSCSHLAWFTSTSVVRAARPFV